MELFEFLYIGSTREHIIWYKLNLKNVDLHVKTGYSKPPFIDKNCIWIAPFGLPFMKVNEFKFGYLLLKKIVFKDGIKLGFIKP